MTPRSFREYFYLAVSASPVILTLALATIVANTLVFKSWHPAVYGAGLLGEASHRVLKHLPAPPLAFSSRFVIPIDVGPASDQINPRLPRSLARRGDVDVVLTVDGKTANTVKINVK